MSEESQPSDKAENQKKPKEKPKLTKTDKDLKPSTPAKVLGIFYQHRDRTPIWVTDKGMTKKAGLMLSEFQKADQYGLRAEDFKTTDLMKQAELKNSPKELADFELSMSKMLLKYAKYARGGRIDPKKLSRFQDRGPTIPDYTGLLVKIEQSDDPAKILRSLHPRHAQFDALRKKLVSLPDFSNQKQKPSKSAVQSQKKLRARLLINMERWRWMPRNLQENNNIYVWTNIPELKVRIIKDGRAIFTQKAITGLRNKQTPMFSDKMEWIEFNPTWFIPNSIKVADILPSLRRKGRVVKRYHLKIDCGKHGTDFTKINWKKVNIRSCRVIQPTGPKSVLGKLKFKFPNKHSVYMHDTLTPKLFNRKHRILSHGCVRVKDPRRMAEILLQNDKKMSATRVRSLLARGGLHTEHLKKPIPVHMTYFSTWVNKDGSIRHHLDYYGHDKRLAKALLGKGHLFKNVYYRPQSSYKRKPRKKKNLDRKFNPFPTH